MSGQSDSNKKIVTSRLGDEKIACTQFAIIGTYSEEQKHFVQHASLLKASRDVSIDESVGVWHCGPPIVATEATERTRYGSQECVVSVVADLDLRLTEREAITNFLKEVEKEYRSLEIKVFQQYKIVPHVEWVRASETGRKIRRRFSCSGFVIEAYVDAGITLVDTQKLPYAALDQVESAYPQLRKIAESNQAIQDRFGFAGLDELGLDGEGPWQVALPGYLFHACDRNQSIEDFETFVVPTVDHAIFPLNT